MARAEATAGWTEVEELRERIERRRTAQADGLSAEPRGSRFVASTEADRSAEPAHVDAATEPRASHGATAPATRRTVRIRGQAIPTVVAPRLRPAEAPGELARPSTEAQPPVRSRPYGTTRPPRPRPRPAERMGANPDRLAAWAFALALLTLLVAAVSAHGL
jgi:hypothetical protein